MASAIDEDEIVNDQTLGAVKLEVDSDLQFGEMMHKTRFNKALKVFSSKHMETILEDVDQEEEAEDAVITALPPWVLVMILERVGAKLIEVLLPILPILPVTLLLPLEKSPCLLLGKLGGANFSKTFVR